MIRLGLCCIFRDEPIKFGNTTATAIGKMKRANALVKLFGLPICRATGIPLVYGVHHQFHKKVIVLLRAANLDDDKLDIAAERLKLLMAKSSGEIKRTPDPNIQRRMDSMVEEAKRLVDELSQSPKKDTAEST